MFFQSLILLLCFLPSLLCQVVIAKDTHCFIWENAAALYIGGSGLELAAKHLEIGAIGQELVRDKDYTVENWANRKGLKISLLTQWIDFTETNAPESLLLKSVRRRIFCKSSGFSCCHSDYISRSNFIAE